MTISINNKELKQLIAKLKDTPKFSRAVSISLYNASAPLASFVKKNHDFKSRTHVLENAVELDVQGLSSSIFVDTAKVKYAGYVYDGTKPHIIKPNNKKLLSWASGGNRFFAKSVKHPGYKGDPFIEKGFEKRRSKFLRDYRKDLTQNLQDIIA